MYELLEKTLAATKEEAVNELDIKKTLRTAAATGLIGGAAAGLGLWKGTAEKPASSVEKPVEKPVITAPKEISKVSIDMSKIAWIESRNDPDTPDSPKGARGLYQIMRPTWEQMVKKMGEDWTWEEAHDADKNTAVANYYMNVEIPRLLKHFGIEDTVENRLAAYNWGAGNLNTLGIDKAPQETVDYIKDYKGM